MPELPEVETERRYLNRYARHRRVVRVQAAHPDILSGISIQALGRKLKGCCIESSRRHGKYLLAGLDSGDWLVMHFGMSGTLAYYAHEQGPPDYAALILLLEGGRDLAYVSPRRLGRISLAGDPEEFIRHQRLGPDALDVGLTAFRECIAAARGAVKAWLMDQGHIAGIGNEYSDEILFHAGLHPGRSAKSLTEAEVGRLHRSMLEVLRRAVAVAANPERMPASWLLPRRGTDSACPRCGGPLHKSKAGGRAAYYCPRCQPR